MPQDNIFLAVAQKDITNYSNYEYKKVLSNLLRNIRVSYRRGAMMKCPSDHTYAKGRLSGGYDGGFWQEQPIAVEPNQYHRAS